MSLYEEIWSLGLNLRQFRNMFEKLAPQTLNKMNNNEFVRPEIRVRVREKIDELQAQKARRKVS